VWALAAAFVGAGLLSFLLALGLTRVPARLLAALGQLLCALLQVLQRAGVHAQQSLLAALLTVVYVSQGGDGWGRLKGAVQAVLQGAQQRLGKGFTRSLTGAATGLLDALVEPLHQGALLLRLLACTTAGLLLLAFALLLPAARGSRCLTHLCQRCRRVLAIALALPGGVLGAPLAGAGYRIQSFGRGTVITLAAQAAHLLLQGVTLLKQALQAGHLTCQLLQVGAGGRRLLAALLPGQVAPGLAAHSSASASIRARMRSSRMAGAGTGTSLVRITELPSAEYWYLLA
jgi:hypothetical protein